MNAPGAKVPKGYRRRASGAAIGTYPGGTLVECPNCHRMVRGLLGYEFDYPNNPDILLCTQCAEELERSRNDT